MLKIAIGAAGLAVAGASAQAIAPPHAMATRWDFEIHGPAVSENGDLRFDGTSGKILLQYDDSAFQILQDLRIGGGTISFVLPRSHRRFAGQVTDTLMWGTVRDADGDESSWFGLPLDAHTTRWPVPPRVTVRQLAMGSGALAETVPGAWRSVGTDTARLESEYRELVRGAGLVPLAGVDRVTRSRRLALGFDSASREVVGRLLARIGAGAAADPLFRQLFMASHGWKLDLHDAALAEAPHYLYRFRLANAASGLRQLGELTDAADSSAIRESAWRLWCRIATDSVEVFARLDSLAQRDATAATSVRALLAGYDDAVAWWQRAVSWLLTRRWLDTPEGPRSPVQLMAAFWGVDSLSLPQLLATRFGDAAAMPVLAAAHMGPYLLRARNASAVEWLAGDGMQQALESWRPIRWGEPPLSVVIAGRAETLVSPYAEGEARPAAFFGDRDAIRIDPGIMPMVAVVTVLHEWQHLMAAQQRLTGSHPVALMDGASQLRLREIDPWLSEGFAEWATEETLRPAGASASFLVFTQAEKRLAIAAHDDQDPHVLGYRLVRGAAARAANLRVFRDQLVRGLHDLPALARTFGLSGRGRTGSLTLHRPGNAAVIPEITFTWEEGSMFDLSRRLVIPNTRSEQ